MGRGVIRAERFLGKIQRVEIANEQGAGLKRTNACAKQQESATTARQGKKRS